MYGIGMEWNWMFNNGFDIAMMLRIIAFIKFISAPLELAYTHVTSDSERVSEIEMGVEVRSRLCAFVFKNFWFRFDFHPISDTYAT